MIKIKNANKNFKIMAVFSLPIIAILFYMKYSYGDKVYVVMLGALDFAFTLAIFLFINLIFKRQLEMRLRELQMAVKNIKALWLIFLILSVVNFYGYISMLGDAEISREYLVYGHNKGHFEFLIYGPTILLAVLAILNGGVSRITAVILIISIVFLNLSRGTILYVVVAMMLLGVYLNTKIKFRTAIYLLIAFALFVLVGVVQGRTAGAEPFYAVEYALMTILYYQAETIGLAEVFVNADFNITMLNPLLGYFGEKIAEVGNFEGLRVGIPGSYFLTDMQQTSLERLSNVTYPWWVWFYGAFGPLGLVLKALFIGTLLFILIKLKMRFTLAYSLILFFITGFRAHPFLDTPGFYAYVGVICLDVYALLIIYKKYK